jgi:hypothetical protein
MGRQTLDRCIVAVQVLSSCLALVLDSRGPVSAPDHLSPLHGSPRRFGCLLARPREATVLVVWLHPAALVLLMRSLMDHAARRGSLTKRATDCDLVLHL